VVKLFVQFETKLTIFASSLTEMGRVALLNVKFYIIFFFIYNNFILFLLLLLVFPKNLFFVNFTIYICF